MEWASAAMRHRARRQSAARDARGCAQACAVLLASLARKSVLNIALQRGHHTSLRATVSSRSEAVRVGALADDGEELRVLRRDRLVVRPVPERGEVRVER